MIIQLSQGKHTVVDEIDSDLAIVKWCTVKKGSESNRLWYATRHERNENNKRINVFIHRLILERIIKRKLTQYEETDHINHDGLDNRRCNIRIATTSENHRNTRKPSIQKTSKYRGVSLCKTSNKWRALIYIQRKKISIGNFINEIDAAIAYDNAARKIHGEYCSTNFQ